ncbi:hypothetical protein JCM8547_003586 [Rhodosporidiobolus lusitaniae]
MPTSSTYSTATSTTTPTAYTTTTETGTETITETPTINFTATETITATETSTPLESTTITNAVTVTTSTVTQTGQTATITDISVAPTPTAYSNPCMQTYARYAVYDANGYDLLHTTGFSYERQCVRFCHSQLGSRADYFGATFSTEGDGGCWCKSAEATYNLQDPAYRANFVNPYRINFVRTTCAELNARLGFNTGCTQADYSISTYY